MGSLWNNLLQEGRSVARVEIIEVGPRDGLQSESKFIPTDTKVALIEALVQAGVTRIQVTSFVHPKLVPQMSDAEEVCRRIDRKPGVAYSGLVLNMKGLERAHAAGLSYVDMSVSASETHSRKNANRSLPQALEGFAAMVARAREYDMTVRGGIQCAFGCVYEGPVDPARVTDIAEHHLALGIDELALADSTGMASPLQVYKLMQRLRPLVGAIPLILHLHDTRGLGLVNVLAALECGVTHFDTAFGGLGGCPFIKGATGNIGTEDTLYMLEEMGIPTGIERRKVAECSRTLEGFLGRQFPGKMHRPELNQAPLGS